MFLLPGQVGSPMLQNFLFCWKIATIGQRYEYFCRYKEREDHLDPLFKSVGLPVPMGIKPSHSTSYTLQILPMAPGCKPPHDAQWDSCTSR